VHNAWWDLINLFFESYLEESFDSILPISRAVDHLYEFIAEQRLEKMIGQGIFLSTIHSAKGMEFPHVFILDGDWRRPIGKSEWEDERRVMYVGMTRAKETLRILKTPRKPNPFLNEIRGDFAIPLTYRESIGVVDHNQRTYELLGLNEIYLDYAGRFCQSDPIHHHLSMLQAGQSVSLRDNSTKLGIYDCEGRCVAQLSNDASNKRKNRLNKILDVRVVAMLKRDRDDPEENFQKSIKANEWELPILEVVYNSFEA
jgi:ATP-dependent DNA helicase RecQ